MFRMFRFGPTREEALCMFVIFFCGSDADMFYNKLCASHVWPCLTCAQEAVLACFVLAQRGKRPCACLIEALWTCFVETV